MSTSPSVFIYLPPLPSSVYRPFAIPYTKSASIPFTPFASHHPPPPTDSYSFWWIRALVAAAAATATAADFGFSLYLCPFVRSACYYPPRKHRPSVSPFLLLLPHCMPLIHPPPSSLGEHQQQLTVRGSGLLLYSLNAAMCIMGIRIRADDC